MIWLILAMTAMAAFIASGVIAAVYIAWRDEPFLLLDEPVTDWQEPPEWPNLPEWKGK